MIVYLLQVSLCWAFFYLIYHLFLRKETFFRINRVYLMTTLLISLFIPQLGYFVHNLLQTSPSELGQVMYYVSETPQIISNIILPEEESTHWSILLLMIFYFVGVLFVAARFMFGLSRIIQLYRSGTKVPKTHFTLVETEKAHLPFSFFQWVFLSKKVPLKKEIREVISHELCHVQSLHSLDIIALELLSIIFWFNPILILYKKALRQAHEYTADASVLANSNVKNYGQILLGQTSSGLEVALVNHFFNSQLKNRITMMYQKRSGKKALFKYLAAIPILLLTAFLFSNSVLKEKQMPKTRQTAPSEAENSRAIYSENEQKSNSNYLTYNHLSTHPADTIPVHPVFKKKNPTEEVFRVVEQMPRFPGCENMVGTESEKEACGKEQMLQYIYNNLKYPEEARDQGVEGMVVIQFVVDKTGTIKDANIIREIGSNCGNAAKAVVESMNSLPEKWTPGKQKGMPVNVVYTLPVRFKLSGSKTKKENVKVINTKTVPQGDSPKMREDGVFLAVESMPRFPGCEDKSLSGNELDQCAKKEMLQYIYTHVTYPKEARDAGIEGTTIIQFVVTKEGLIRDAKILRDIGNGCGQVALKVVESMNSLSEKWIPGEQNGEKVDVAYTLPIRFKIQDKTSEPIAIGKEALPIPDPSKDPLYIIDGTIMKKGGKVDLQPSNIKSISVLKDESAVNKYGESARNGAIEITTKTGKSNIKTNDQEKITFKTSKSLDLEGVDDKFLVILNDQPSDIPLVDMKLDPKDIDRINVLKGEAAIKKYGENGKNGVLEIYLLDKNFVLPDSKELYSVSKPGISQASIKMGNPLVVLDEIVIGRGTEVIENLDPKDIKSIQVYKDESAVEKYGSEGKEGVIEITTHSKNYQETGILPAEIGTLKRSSFLDEFKAFPIPAKGSINLQIEGDKGPLQIRVFSLTGQMIHTEDFNSFSGKMVAKLQNPAFTNTTAIIAIIQGGKVQTKKVIFN